MLAQAIGFGLSSESAAELDSQIRAHGEGLAIEGTAAGLSEVVMDLFGDWCEL